jgi:hypothetical protein
MLNAATVLSYNQVDNPNTTTWLAPQNVLDARVAKLGATSTGSPCQTWRAPTQQASHAPWKPYRSVAPVVDNDGHVKRKRSG